MEVTDPLLDARESAALLDVSVPTYWRRVKDGTVKPPIKIGALSRWPRSEILGVIEAAKARRDTGFSVTRTADGMFVVLDATTGLSASGKTLDEASAELRRLLAGRQAA